MPLAIWRVPVVAARRARDPAAARLGTLTRVRRTHAPRDRLVRPTLAALVHRRRCAPTAESARLADGAVRLASAPDRRCRFAIAGSPPPGVVLVEPRRVRLPLEPASGPGRGAGDPPPHGADGDGTRARGAACCTRRHTPERVSSLHRSTKLPDTSDENCNTIPILYTGARCRDNRVPTPPIRNCRLRHTLDASVSPHRVARCADCGHRTPSGPTRTRVNA